MLRSLYSGITGMRVNQTKMDVIGNNISNVGTTAFKVSRARFQDMISQQVTAATGPMANQGGINPSQVGLGVQLAGIDTVVKQGMMIPTSRNLDVAVDGEGYIMVAKGPKSFDDTKFAVTDHAVTASTDTELLYTRDGSFTLDSEGNLLTSDGYRVMGYSINGSIDADGNLVFADASGVITADEGNLKTLRIPDVVVDGNVELRVRSFSISKEGVISAVLEDGRVSALGQIAMVAFKNPAGLSKMGKNLFQQSVNSGDPVLRSGVGSPDDNSKGYGDMLQGMLEGSNVDLAEQFTDMIVTSRSFQAAGKMITTGDEILQDIINLKR
ncbi:flagellar hook-basal body complex protein [Clostridium thermarum]|uniref:flagellar hook-basal body complex protein n=1 Tax=Clostridium thermarum TaxID=1716543 RepID=UPI0011227C60|nr:flagellar hook-basal body complex protein [Clostridium thermarum]